MCWHKWTKWRRVTEIESRSMYGMTSKAEVMHQLRECSKCGYIQMERVSPI